jgi:pantetheine-phosphate adenylyltransferase/dephospho-CoA kinase
MKTFGLTGNIGCGKSTIAKMLAEIPGVKVIDCDALAKEQFSNNTNRDAINRAIGFGAFVGTMPDFRFIADAIFSDADKRNQIENLIHPLVREQLRIEKEKYTGDLLIIESAILYEKNMEEGLDKVIVVTCDEDEQYRRLKVSRNMTNSEIANRLKLQLSQDEKQKRAQFVINTNCTLEVLRERVMELYVQLTKEDNGTSQVSNQETVLQNKKMIVVYPGTFDPLTLGHEWMIERSAHLFDEVVVVIGVNASKAPLFVIEERKEMVTQFCKSFSNVKVVVVESEYITQYAASIDATVLVRGIRNIQDFEYEKLIQHVNIGINDQIETLFLIPPHNKADISSSLVRSLIGPGGWERVIAKYISADVFEKICMKKHTIWRNLVDIGAQGDEKMFWREIFDAYSSKNNRYYHTIFHPMSMMCEFEKIKHLLQNPVAVETAIWLHDLVQVTTGAGSEEFTRERTRRILETLGLPESFIKVVESLILTTHHTLEHREDNDEQYMRDIDIAVFGKYQKEFNEYEKGIREEYKHVPDMLFNPIRKRLLQKVFLAREHIYSTEFFRNKYEVQARKNLMFSLRKL